MVRAVLRILRSRVEMIYLLDFPELIGGRVSRQTKQTNKTNSGGGFLSRQARIGL